MFVQSFIPISLTTTTHGGLLSLSVSIVAHVSIEESKSWNWERILKSCVYTGGRIRIVASVFNNIEWSPLEHLVDVVKESIAFVR